MGDKGEGGVKDLKKWLTSFMDDLFSEDTQRIVVDISVCLYIQKYLV